jgi:hypothetical protein
MLSSMGMEDRWLYGRLGYFVYRRVWRGGKIEIDSFVSYFVQAHGLININSSGFWRIEIRDEGFALDLGLSTLNNFSL